MLVMFYIILARGGNIPYLEKLGGGGGRGATRNVIPHFEGTVNRIKISMLFEVLNINPVRNGGLSNMNNCPTLICSHFGQELMTYILEHRTFVFCYLLYA